jgi:hypothetical protein
MKVNTLLQIFLLVDVFLAGVVSASALRQLWEHFRPVDPNKNKSVEPAAKLPEDVTKRILKAAEVNFEKSLDQAAAELERDMAATAGKINQLLEHLGNDVIGNELEGYRKELLELRQKAIQDLGNVNTEVAKHESELKLKLTEEMEAEKERLIKQIDTKLADAVAAFLVETLQHNVDLGAQTAYLNQMLEEHKDEFKKGVADEAETAS